MAVRPRYQQRYSHPGHQKHEALAATYVALQLL